MLSVNDDTADSGMYNMGHRNYAGGVLGRFVSRDPIGHAGGLNLYNYTTSPVNQVDPAGLQPLMGTDYVHSHHAVDFIVPGSPFHNQINQGLSQLETLTEMKMSSHLNEMHKDGHLLRLPSSFPKDVVGFNNPITKNIGLSESYCTGSTDPDLNHLRTTSLLFHEAYHNIYQGHTQLLIRGIHGHWMGDPVSWWKLEAPAYQAEARFLRGWESRSNGNLKTLIGLQAQSIENRLKLREQQYKDGLKEQRDSCKFRGTFGP